MKRKLNHIYARLSKQSSNTDTEVTKSCSATQVAHSYVKQDCISVQLSEQRTQMHLHHYSLPCLAGDPDARMQECVEQSPSQSSKATLSDTGKKKMESACNVDNLSECCVQKFVASVRIGYRKRPPRG